MCSKASPSTVQIEGRDKLRKNVSRIRVNASTFIYACGKNTRKYGYIIITITKTAYRE